MLRPRVLAAIGALASTAAAGAAPTTTFRVPAESMYPTLRVGQYVTVDLGARPPRRGDIVVFHPPAGAVSGQDECGHRPAKGAMCDRPAPRLADARFLKRVVALGGDRIAMRRGRLTRNGRTLAEPYAAHCHPGEECDFPHPIVVPRGTFYALGDNRGASDDSRFWGPVPLGAIVGTVRP